ncbi:thiamine phosphate synthase [Rhodococcus sp. BP-149]|nr:thiamine phosphate synthase [Rhodococcus sp. BP-288]MBY6692727.1 thiamine phosphate synthase [Rhodococcus sp. BP-188]MBY6698625.1 thiamine phosphate synthase [Rhodococcus sp. BP-285]MBY6701304.1 thiamine phosphate synthase [Rhodococcus sp. BP-283]MBY6712305.1 thiamine phosphate synthase [Rhodococcus sp. BP-160]MBY6714272.1 thiamine phosphate synthase [Rhodococcus sp. BP-110]MBY6719553.1 thiamine phosphate synthase [Rhodococcus sp. BP-142]MBY6722834.1 thiamine phosphate synthase [Rhodococc
MTRPASGLPAITRPASGLPAEKVGTTFTLVTTSRTTARERLATARLYLCTDARRDTGDLAKFVDAALSGGVDIVQLRDKGSAGEKKYGAIEAKDELAALAVISAACRRHGALMAVNDRADLALASGADVLHLGQNDLPVHYARRIVGPDVVIGRSTQNRAQATLADIEDGVDYFATGPVWATPTKPNRSAAGLDVVREVAESHPTRPWFVIGGVEENNVAQALEAGASRIAVVRAITQARDPEAAARRLLDLLPSV